MKNVLSDAGRSESKFFHEKRDCTVRALSHASGMSYTQAHQIMEEEGRKPGKGGAILQGLINARRKHLLEYSYIDLPTHERIFNAAPGYFGINGRAILTKRIVGPTVRQFVEQHQIGRYIVIINRHAFAVIDGVIYDKFKQHGGALVQSAWEIKSRLVL